ncbi:hypothetical protein [Microcoleus sp. F4-D5]
MKIDRPSELLEGRSLFFTADGRRLTRMQEGRSIFLTKESRSFTY